jgi:exodeoxyribonuclease V gamma subunit
MPTQLYFSNDVESLADVFAERIACQRDWTDPDTIIVPNPYLKKWLQLKIAGINGIAMNLKFEFLTDGLWSIVKLIHPSAAAPVMLEHRDLQLMLYLAVINLDSGNSRVRPIMEYLFDSGGIRVEDYEKKAWQLSSRLARYFLEYELYREDMIRAWLDGKLAYHSDMEAAQQYLYYSVFKKNGYSDTLHKNSYTLPQYWNSVANRIRGPLPHKLHLFGESQMSPFHIRMIYDLGRYLDISIYQMNPCSEFWEDITTPGEDRWGRVRSIAVVENREGHVLEDNEDENQLLKQWGKTGREAVKMLSLLEEAGSGDFSFVSQWITSESPRPDISCLHTIQSQILNRTTRTGSQKKISQDTSIQIASSPDIFREVEAVYNSILYNLESDGNLKMTDIAVMVPDMAAYGPVLQTVFSRRPKRITFNMIDVSSAAHGLFGEALLAVLEMATGPFSRKTVFDLVFNRCFLAACSLTMDEASLWLAWTDALNIFHGFAEDDAVDPGRNPYTWQQGLQRLRLGRIMDPSESERHSGLLLDYRNIIPFTGRDTNDQRLVDTFVTTIELLYSRVRDLPVHETSGTEWQGIIESLIFDFIAIPADKPDEKLVMDALMAGLKKLSVLDAYPDAKRSGMFSFPFIKEFISEHLADIPGRRGGYLTGGINISALVPKRLIPFKIIYILGMQEGMFPGTGDFSTLNLMNIKRKIGDVGRPDVNRYLFLETLLGIREKMYISYISKDLHKDQDFHPNSVVGQLITYLNNHVLTEDFKISHVPSSGSSEQYLDATSGAGYSDFVTSSANGAFHTVNYSETDMLVLLNKALKNSRIDPKKAFEISEKLALHSPRFALPHEENAVQETSVTVSVRDLANYLINPIESALRWHLDIYDEDDENRAYLEDEPFFSVYPHYYRFIADVLNYYIRSGPNVNLEKFIQEYYERARLMSVTPYGAFAAVDLDTIKSTVMSRVSTGESLSAFLQSRKNSSFYRNVSFGSSVFNGEPDMVFPPVRCTAVKNGRPVAVELRGVFSFLWKNSRTGELETLVVTNGARPMVNSIIYPFLAYVISISGYDKNLQQFMESGSFTIHESYKNGITAYRYCLAETACKEYLGRVLNDLFNESGFDMLPIQIIANNKRLVPADWQERPDDSIRSDYQRALARLINDDAEKTFPSFRPMSIIGMMDVRVPPDAYDKVRDRLGILLKPFVHGDTEP